MQIALPPVRLSGTAAELARRYLAGDLEPVEPRDAATVIVLRDGTGPGPEVYLLHRQTSMAFAAGMAVFPGGGVDPRDGELPESAWSGPSASAWAGRLGCTETEARALVCAAVRETFEESGVLLAGPASAPGRVVGDVAGEDWERDRAALESRELSLTDLLARRGLALRTELLGIWSAWTTPAFEPRRYRTWFFTARLPQGQVTRDVSTESSSVAWLAAGEAIAAAERGELGLMPPTYLNCLELSGYADAAAVIAATRDRSVEMFTPEAEPVADGLVLSLLPHHAALLETHRRG
ncbi:MAG: NUDIX hydrolase [Nocardioides sp.]|uniref:NUDIX hydrolase n=1 Tax=Nocardioides sp. TaxID=35761 RepID=UPI0039E5AC6D